MRATSFSIWILRLPFRRVDAEGITFGSTFSDAGSVVSSVAENALFVLSIQFRAEFENEPAKLENEPDALRFAWFDFDRSGRVRLCCLGSFVWGRSGSLFSESTISKSQSASRSCTGTQSTKLQMSHL
jgi:hypothetical protein